MKMNLLLAPLQSNSVVLVDRSTSKNNNSPQISSHGARLSRCVRWDKTMDSCGADGATNRHHHNPNTTVANVFWTNTNGPFITREIFALLVETQEIPGHSWPDPVQALCGCSKLELRNNSVELPSLTTPNIC